MNENMNEYIYEFETNMTFQQKPDLKSANFQLIFDRFRRSRRLSFPVSLAVNDLHMPQFGSCS